MHLTLSKQDIFSFKYFCTGQLSHPHFIFENFSTKSILFSKNKDFEFISLILRLSTLSGVIGTFLSYIAII